MIAHITASHFQLSIPNIRKNKLEIKIVPTGGTAMFSLLAMAGDLGGSRNNINNRITGKNKSE